MIVSTKVDHDSKRDLIWEEKKRRRELRLRGETEDAVAQQQSDYQTPIKEKQNVEDVIEKPQVQIPTNVEEQHNVEKSQNDTPMSKRDQVYEQKRMRRMQKLLQESEDIETSQNNVQQPNYQTPIKEKQNIEDVIEKPSAIKQTSEQREGGLFSGLGEYERQRRRRKPVDHEIPLKPEYVSPRQYNRGKHIHYEQQDTSQERGLFAGIGEYERKRRQRQFITHDVPKSRIFGNDKYSKMPSDDGPSFFDRFGRDRKIIYLPDPPPQTVSPPLSYRNQREIEREKEREQYRRKYEV